jgi:hypothetical protein
MDVLRIGLVGWSVPRRASAGPGPINLVPYRAGLKSRAVSWPVGLGPDGQL